MKRRQSKLDELPTSKSSSKEETSNKAVKRPSTFTALFKIPKKLKQDTSSIDNERTSNQDSKKKLRKGGKLEESHSSNRQQFMEDPSFLSDLDKSNNSLKLYAIDILITIYLKVKSI
jgi:hypothetical protein